MSQRQSAVDPHAERTRMDTLHVTSDPEANALYVRVGRGRVASTREVPVTCLADLDDDGHPLGIELLGILSRLEPAVTPTRRLRECVERWPECATSMYDPRRSRFPKSCSATIYSDDIDETLLEPAVTSTRPEHPDEAAEDAHLSRLAREALAEVEAGAPTVPLSEVIDQIDQSSLPVCTRRPRSGEPLGAFCPDCGHAYLLHSTQGGPCGVCALHAAAEAIGAGR